MFIPNIVGSLNACTHRKSLFMSCGFYQTMFDYPEKKHFVLPHLYACHDIVIPFFLLNYWDHIPDLLCTTFQWHMFLSSCTTYYTMFSILFKFIPNVIPYKNTDKGNRLNVMDTYTKRINLCIFPVSLFFDYLLQRSGIICENIYK